MLTLRSDAGCLVDDVQWVDGPSAGALAFVARRLRDEPVVLLAADRIEPGPGSADFSGRTDLGDSLVSAGLPERVVAPLCPAQASALLAEQAGTVPPAVRDALLAAAAGNPLALLELPATLSPAQLAGTAPLPEPLPLAGELGPGAAGGVSQTARRATDSERSFRIGVESAQPPQSPAP